MRIVRSVAEMASLPGTGVGFVPTMGAFHEGHLQLMRRAGDECERVVVSIFVNPTQFGKNEDFSRYPRNLERDVEMAESVGVDIVFAPEVSEIYRGSPTLVHVPEVTDRWEGAARPGHFDGVATVVLKLFNIVRPEVAFFGQKDIQQCLVVRRMVRDLDVPIRLSFETTTRESDGLAMSSRNAYLSDEDRRTAPLLGETIHKVATTFSGVESGTSNVEDILAIAREELRGAGFDVDYLALVDLEALSPTTERHKPSAIIVAARLGRTRLIDNVILHGDRLAKI